MLTTSGGGGQEDARRGGGVGAQAAQGERHQSAGDAADHAAAGHRGEHDGAQRPGVGVALARGHEHHAAARDDADQGAVEQSEPGLLGEQAAMGARVELAQGETAQRHRERLAAGGFPDCPASTGRNMASTTIWSMVSWKNATTPAARKAVKRLSCSQG